MWGRKRGPRIRTRAYELTCSSLGEAFILRCTALEASQEPERGLSKAPKLLCVWTNLSQPRGGLLLETSRWYFIGALLPLSFIPQNPGHPPSSPLGRASVSLVLRSVSEPSHLQKSPLPRGCQTFLASEREET